MYYHTNEATFLISRATLEQIGHCFLSQAVTCYTNLNTWYIQSTLNISNSQGTGKKVQDIESSTYRESEKKYLKMN